MLYRTSLVASLLLVACGNPRVGGEGVDASPGPDGASYPEPRTDLVPRVGSEAALDIGTWNIENFPLNPATPSTVADLIASMDLDVIAVQEIESVEAFDELIARLPDHDGVLSTHSYSNGSYQKVGVIYRADLVSVGTPVLLFDRMGYEFPRPPLQVDVSVSGADLDLVLVTTHLKAGRDFEDRERREAAMIALADHLGTVAAEIDPDIVALGDFNEVITSTEGLAVFDPFLEGADYTLHTEVLAAEGKFSFVPSKAILDHVITSAALADELAGADELIPPLHVQLVNYESSVSDHLPVVVSIPIF